MTNKIIIVVLTISVLLIGAVSSYSLYMNNELSQSINSMSEDINNFSDEIKNNMNDLVEDSNALESNLQDINTELTIIDEKVDNNLSHITIIDEKVDNSLSHIVTLIDEVGLNTEKYNELEGEIEDVVLELSEDRSRLAANRIYNTVIQSVVRISDGTNTIGSGYVYDSQGYVVTAQHVTAELSNIYVIFEDGQTSRASLIGSSETSDVSILLIHNQLDITPVRMADSHNIQIGEAVIAIGSPFDLSGTVTSGIVSQIDRAEIIGDETDSRLISNLIQFDAPANFGNSGGPLFNIDGDVIGLIIARVGPTFGEGISYAVSANKITKVADTIINTGFYNYPWLGIGVNDITPETAEKYNVHSINGIIVNSVVPSSPADQAGLQPDDIIVNVDGRTMRKVDDLTSYLGEFTSPGDIISITIDRKDNLINLNATLGVQ